MSRMAASLSELEALRAATRVRLLRVVYEDLRELHADMEAAATTVKHRREAAGLGILLDMHDKLEALDRG